MKFGWVTYEEIFENRSLENNYAEVNEINQNESLDYIADGRLVFRYAYLLKKKWFTILSMLFYIYFHLLELHALILLWNQK